MMLAVVSRFTRHLDMHVVVALVCSVPAGV